MASPLEVFQRFVPHHLQRAVCAGRAILQPLRDASPGAVLFFDISGFTFLSDRFARRGRAGIEALTFMLNAYFGALVETILEHGGDVVSFGGDAMLAIWQGDSLEDAILRATQCGLALQQRMTETAAVAVEKLALKVAIDAGEVSFNYVGGVRGRWEAFVSGDALHRICHPDLPLVPGLVQLSPAAASRVKARVAGEPLPSGWWRVASIPSELPHRPLPELQVPPERGDAIKAFVPAAIRTRLEAGQGDWLAELRQVTALFINLPEVDDQTPIARSHELLVEIQSAVYRFEGSIYQFGVDNKGLTVVAAFGLPPLSHEDDPLRGALAAVAAREVLQARGVRFKAGVTTGRVFSGIIGTQRRRMYALIGDCMNMAARLMERTDRDVLCDAATHAAASARIDFQPVDPFVPRGKLDPVTAFRPLGRRGAITFEPRTETIGRFAERRFLEERLRALRASRAGGVVAIEGEAGIGKSHLVHDLIAQANQAGAVPLVGAADPIERNTAWFPWRNVVRALVSALDAGVTSLPEDDRPFAPLLNALVETGLPESDVTAQMTGEARGETTHRLVVQLLKARAAEAPLLLVLEDAHWFDSASWKLAAMVAREVPSVLFVLSTRPLADAPGDDGAAWLASADVARLRLDGLPMAEALQLAARRLGVDALPPPVADLIRARAGGNPFYGDELVQEMLETRAISVEDGRCQVLSPDLQALNVPNTLEGIITTRIDRVPPSLQLTLKVASVIGRVFEQETLRGIYPVSDERPQLESYLDRLDSLGFTLKDAPPPNLRYVFKHVITRDVAYNLMLFAQRRDLHRALADWIEQHHAEDPQLLPLLAHHYTMADNKPRAVSYLVKAAKQALDSYANREALNFLDEITRIEAEGRISPSSEEEVQREEMRAEALMRLGRYGDAIVHFETALRLLGSDVAAGGLSGAGQLLREVLSHVRDRLATPRRRLGDGRERLLRAARIRNELVKLYFFAGKTLPGLHSMMRQLNESEAAGPSPELASALATAGAFFEVLGMHKAARYYNGRAEKLLGEIDRLAAKGYVCHVLCFQNLCVAEWEPARKWLDASIAHFARLGALHTERALHPQQDLGTLECYAGRLREATDTLLRVAQLAARSTNTAAQLGVHAMVAETLLRRGRCEEAAEHASRSLQLIGTQAFPAEKLLAFSVLARADQILGRESKARQAAAGFAPLLTYQRGLSYVLIFGLANAAQYHLTRFEAGLSGEERRGEERAVARALAAIRGFAGVYPFGRPAHLRCSAQWARLRGRRDQAARLAGQSVEAARRLSMPYEEGLALLELARCNEDRAAVEAGVRVLSEIGAGIEGASPPNALPRAASA